MAAAHATRNLALKNLIGAMQHGHVEAGDLSMAHMRLADCKLLSDALASTSSLRRLHLQYCTINDACLAALLPGIVASDRLEVLDLLSNKITRQGVAALQGALQRSRRAPLTVFLSGNTSIRKLTLVHQPGPAIAAHAPATPAADNDHGDGGNNNSDDDNNNKNDGNDNDDDNDDDARAGALDPTALRTQSRERWQRELELGLELRQASENAALARQLSVSSTTASSDSGAQLTCRSAFLFDDAAAAPGTPVSYSISATPRAAEIAASRQAFAVDNEPAPANASAEPPPACDAGSAPAALHETVEDGPAELAPADEEAAGAPALCPLCAMCLAAAALPAHMRECSSLDATTQRERLAAHLRNPSPDLAAPHAPRGRAASPEHLLLPEFADAARRDLNEAHVRRRRQAAPGFVPGGLRSMLRLQPLDPRDLSFLVCGVLDAAEQHALVRLQACKVDIVADDRAYQINARFVLPQGAGDDLRTAAAAADAKWTLCMHGFGSNCTWTTWAKMIGLLSDRIGSYRWRSLCAPAAQKNCKPANKHSSTTG